MQTINDIPILGFGTWDIRGDEGFSSISKAIQVGYRHLDTADWYRNHDIVGEAMTQSGIDRSEFFLVTKVFPPLRPDKVIDDARRFLKELQTDYIDLLLIHWPDEHTPVAETLGAMKKLQLEGVIKQIGVSNFDEPDLEQAFESGIEVVNDQIEIFPGQTQQSLVEFCKDKGVSVTAYSPLERGRNLNHELLLELAEKYEHSPAQIILSWLIGKEIIVIPKASSDIHIEENWKCQDIKLDPEDSEKLDNLG